LEKEKNSKYIELPVEENKHHCPGMSRRTFMKATGATLAGLALPLNLISCNEVPVVLHAVDPPVGTSTVAIVRKDDIEEMVMAAIDMSGGLGEIASGDTVVIKPNILLGMESLLKHRVYTHPDVLRAVIKAVKTRTSAQNITVADASSFGMSTKVSAQQTGMLDITIEEGVNFQAWETGLYVSATSESFEHIDFNIRIPSALMDGSFDHFINVPILKNHDRVPCSNVDYTCCIKNHVGLLHPVDRIAGGCCTFPDVIYGSPLDMGIHKADLGEISAELNLAVPRHAMNIVDALTIVLSGGAASLNMEVAEAGLILASKDRVACDSLAVAVLRHYASEKGICLPYVNKSVWDQAQILHAQHLNLGRTRENIEIVSDNVNNFEDILNMWS
jgi:uncharacterized protein (DUF362 family)